MQPKRNKFLSVLLMLAAAAGLISGLSAAAYADWIQYQEASYSDSDGVTYETKIASNATALTSSTTNWSNGGWYYVQGSVTVSSRITVTGTVNLILCDGAVLSVDNGINVSSDYTLNIYGQSGGTGTLTAAGGYNQAGIGGGYYGAGGTVNIHGGNINATGGGPREGVSDSGAGIGGGRREAGGTINIHGGTIIATGGDGDYSGGAGIGGGNSTGSGNSGAGGTVTIYNGTVTATGGSNSGCAGAGIGGGDSGKGGTVYIYGGTVTAAGGLSSAQGIGGGRNGNSGTLTVSGDHLLVFSGSSANPATVIFSPYSTRHQYMGAAAGYIVSFDKNSDNASGTMSPQGVRVSSPDLTLPEISFDITGYSFDHWNTKSDDTGTSYADKAKITVSKNITLYAQWKAITYAISYDLNGGTVATANPTSYDVESSDITLVNPTRDAYDFSGWTGTGLSGNTANVTIPTGSTGNREYTANYTPITYTITYNLNGGTNGAGNPTSYTVESATITLADATKTGGSYDNGAWFTARLTCYGNYCGQHR